jgi:hypothetical protein
MKRVLNTLPLYRSLICVLSRSKVDSSKTIDESSMSDPIILELKEIVKLDFGNNQNVEDQVIKYFVENRTRIEDLALSKEAEHFIDVIYDDLGVLDNQD